jgi:sn-glycerol 3-phosphate transport system substrate-binding protein
MTNRKGLFVVLMAIATLVLAVAPAFAQTATDVRVWIAFTDYRLDWAQQKAATFNAQFPQYNVTVEGYANYEELFAATALAAEQDSLPAVVQYFEVATQDARDSGYFKSIASALGDRTEVNGIPVNLDDFIAPVAAYYTLGGEFTSMPWNTSSAIMFSNSTILEAAGVEGIPATWAEVEAACELVMALESAPEFCFTWPNHGWFFEQWVAQQDAALANNDNGRTDRATEVTLNSDAGIAVVSWLQDMYNKGYLYYSGAQGGDSWATVDQAFQTQQVAMAAYSSSDTAVYTQTGVDNGFTVTASFLPYNQETGWTGNLIGGASLWLTDGLPTEVEDGALSFLLWFTDTENAAEWHQVTGYMPIRISAVELLSGAGWYDAISPEASQVWMDNALVQASQGSGWFETNPNFVVAANQLAESEVTAATSGALLGAFPSIRNVVTQAIDTAILTGADATETLTAAATEANTILSEYNLLSAE